MFELGTLIGVGFLALIVGLFFGIVFTIYYTQKLIRSGKKVPRYLEEVGVKMPKRK